MKLAVDVGYGYTKAVSETGQRACFPSVAAPYRGDALGIQGVMGKGAFGHRVSVRDLSGRREEHLVGEAARESFLASGFLGAEKPEGLHDLLLLAGVYLAGAGSTGQFPEPLELAVGLPLAFCRSQGKRLKERLLRLKAWVSVDGGEERCVSFSRVVVLPQGVGVVFHQGLPEGRGYAGVVDVGEYTTDYLLVDLETGKPLVEACGSVQAGCHLVGHAVSIAWLQAAGEPLPPRLLPEVLKDLASSGRTVCRGVELDLSLAWRTALGQVAETIARQVLSAWRDLTSRLAVTYLAGGGALLLGDTLAERFPNPALVSDPVFANALGYLEALDGSR
ncbi:ParM/StbA family protein [Desulfothermobacter acidiphilus]|uniref:ParM/StbA family protein n=1 Tax=Desulfothermobacter acidiphilus TaxID=1938353 RepID=UPI003F8A60D6